MSNGRILISLVFLCFVLFNGCTNTNTATLSKSVVPEPYTKMIENMNSDDLDMTEKYADLVIKDFPDSDYVYNAYLVKNMIISSKLGLNALKASLLNKGTKNMDNFNSESDFNTVKKYVSDILTNFDSLQKDYKTTTIFLLDHYSESKIIKIKFNKAPSDMIALNENDFPGLMAFSYTGYPAPTEDDLTGNDNSNTLKMFYCFNNGFLDNEFSYIDYFYNISSLGDDDELTKRLQHKVIELTEGDQYNEFRIKAQDDLAKL